MYSYLENNYTMRFPDATLGGIIRVQAEVLYPLGYKILGNQGKDTWTMTASDRAVSIEVANESDIARLESHLTQVDLTWLTGPVVSYPYSISYYVKRSELMARAVALASRSGSGSYWAHHFYEAQDEALQDLRLRMAKHSFGKFEINQNTQTIGWDMRITCSFANDNDRFLFKMAFC